MTPPFVTSRGKIKIMASRIQREREHINQHAQGHPTRKKEAHHHCSSTFRLTLSSGSMVRPRLVEEGEPIGSPPKQDYFPAKSSNKSPQQQHSKKNPREKRAPEENTLASTKSSSLPSTVVQKPSSLTLALEGKLSSVFVSSSTGRPTLSPHSKPSYPYSPHSFVTPERRSLFGSAPSSQVEGKRVTQYHIEIKSPAQSLSTQAVLDNHHPRLQSPADSTDISEVDEEDDRSAATTTRTSNSAGSEASPPFESISFQLSETLGMGEDRKDTDIPSGIHPTDLDQDSELEKDAESTKLSSSVREPLSVSPVEGDRVTVTDTVQENSVHFLGDVQEDISRNRDHTRIEFPERKQSVERPFPLFSIREGLATKASVTKFDSWIAVALTLDGRDKITKIAQYTARLLAWWFAGTSGAKRFAALKASLTTSRKAYRLGRSLIELQRIRSLGLLELIGVHWENSLKETEPPRAEFLRQASSNIGFHPPSLSPMEVAPRRSLLRSLSSTVYSVYRPLSRKLSVRDEAESIKDPLWKLLGTTVKLLGLLGFWTGDNISFLTGSGLFDDYSEDGHSRLKKRMQLQEQASLFANRSYFAGAIAGFIVSLRAYLSHTRNKVSQLVHDVLICDDDEEKDEIRKRLVEAREKQFFLFLSLLKSTCDVLVFSNNPGIDLWQRYRGKKMHEGIHCLLGLTSASAVICNNFPDVK